MLLQDRIKSAIRDVKDYPKQGIIFKDITPVFADPGLVSDIIDEFAVQYKDKRIDAVAAVEARGFIFGSILAHKLNCRFIPVRKAGKLPYQKRSKSYSLEYGKASIEMHVDAVEQGWNILVHDDLLATGGTAVATAQLIEDFRANVIGFSFLVNLSFLSGEEMLMKEFGIKPDYLVSY